MVTENFISSKARPVARNIKVNANLSSIVKESLITIFSGQIWSNTFEQFIEKLIVLLYSACSKWPPPVAMQFSARIFREAVAQAML